MVQLVHGTAGTHGTYGTVDTYGTAGTHGTYGTVGTYGTAGTHIAETHMVAMVGTNGSHSWCAPRLIANWPCEIIAAC